MKKSIFSSICLVAMGVSLAASILIMGVLYDYFSTARSDRLKTEAELVSQAVEQGGMEYLKSLPKSEVRLTWIDSAGGVLYDSGTPAEKMENHFDRDEVQQALSTGRGESSRYSQTLMERQIYAARRLSDGTVIRLSDTHLSPLSLFLLVLQPIAVVVVIAIVLSTILAFGLSKRIMRPLNELDLNEPLKNKGYEELYPLLDRIDSQQQQLKAQSAELKRRQKEFSIATDKLNEGLILLNDQGVILSINPAASQLLSISTFCIGKDILLLHNSLPLQELLRKAKNGERGEITLTLDGAEHQINASPVILGGTVTGISLLIFDIGEKEQAERIRREFTANVSHELKTPLQSISGCAELLKEGMVKPEDAREFSGRIYDETQRLICLVNDIIQLSQLDESGGDLLGEKVELAAAAREVIRSLQPAADKAGVSVSCMGGPAYITGVPRLIGEILYNLCDNAIKYNRRNGSVSVEIRDGEKEATLSVRDTGIGIPPEHRERVFERFYRVDKSRSKEMGGTGLGLSIVKHAVRLHGGTIDLQSIVDGGTAVTIRFPK